MSESDVQLLQQEGLGHNYKHPAAMFILGKILLIVTYLVICKMDGKTTLEFILFIGALTIDFLISKNIGGPELVGLSWYVASDLDTNSLMQFLSKPYPFVPNNNDSNLFWLTSIGTLVVHLLAIIISFIKRTFFYSFLLIFGLLIESINLMLFVHAHSLLQKENAKIARGDLFVGEDPLNLAAVI